VELNGIGVVFFALRASAVLILKVRCVLLCATSKTGVVIHNVSMDDGSFVKGCLHLGEFTQRVGFFHAPRIHELPAPEKLFFRVR
jgi:hypothetical protein